MEYLILNLLGYKAKFKHKVVNMIGEFTLIDNLEQFLVTSC